jgi:hypothetical protein
MQGDGQSRRFHQGEPAAARACKTLTHPIVFNQLQLNAAERDGEDVAKAREDWRAGQPLMQGERLPLYQHVL